MDVLLFAVGLPLLGLLALGAYLVRTFEGLSRPEKPKPLPARRDTLPPLLTELINAEDVQEVIDAYWRERMAGRLHVGFAVDGWFGAESRKAMLIFGPPGKGKSMRGLVPQALTHDGPAVL